MSEKTNVMRILDQKKIKYKQYNYEKNNRLSGDKIAEMLGENPNQVFKTLVTVSKSKNYYVFVIPVNSSLDLKKAAKSVKEKSVSMIKEKELLPLTGYIHGGCSPIGMKKFFKTTIDDSCLEFENIIFSAGKVGYQVDVKLSDLSKVIKYQTFSVIK